jgi:hypothetical protein
LPGFVNGFLPGKNGKTRDVKTPHVNLPMCKKSSVSNALRAQTAPKTAQEPQKFITLSNLLFLGKKK